MKSYKYIVLALLLPFAIVSNAQDEGKTLKDVLTEALNDNSSGCSVTAKLVQAVGLMEQLGIFTGEGIRQDTRPPQSSQ